MKSGKVVLGLLAGVAIGAALGILYAPDKGWNTRKRISKKTEDIVEDLREKFEEFLDISVKVDEAKEHAADIADNVNEHLSDIKEETQTATS